MSIEVVDLNGEWKLKDSDFFSVDPARFSLSNIDTKEWYKTTVPGDVYPTLKHAGIIADPFIDKNTEQCLWVGQKDWWYRRDVIAILLVVTVMMLLVLMVFSIMGRHGHQNWNISPRTSLLIKTQ